GRMGCDVTAEAAAALLGTSTAILGVWEERFGFPVPVRSDDGQRLYPDEMMIALCTALGRTLSVPLRSPRPAACSRAAARPTFLRAAFATDLACRRRNQRRRDETPIEARGARRDHGARAFPGRGPRHPRRASEPGQGVWEVLSG